MTFDDLLRDMPRLHSWDGGLTWNTGGFDSAQLRQLFQFLSGRVGLDGRFLETGAGLSTAALLALQPAGLITIAPDADLFDRLRATCRRYGIATDPLDAICDESRWSLPRIACNEPEPFLDFALIDGCHGWPAVFVDLE